MTDANQDGNGGGALTVSLLDEDRLRLLLGTLLDERLGGLEARLDLLRQARKAPEQTKRGPVLLCERELASLLGLHPRTIRRLECNREVPPSVSVGASKRWRLQDIEDWVAGLN